MHNLPNKVTPTTPIAHNSHGSPLSSTHLLENSTMDFRLNCEEVMAFDTKKFLHMKKAEKLHVNIRTLSSLKKTLRRSCFRTTGSLRFSVARDCTCWT